MLGSKFKLRLGTRSWSLNWQLSLTACQPGHSNNRLLGTRIRERLKLKSLVSIQGRAMGTESGCSGGRHPNCCLSEQLYSFPFRKKDILGKIFFFLRRTFCCLHFVKCSCFLTTTKNGKFGPNLTLSLSSPQMSIVFCISNIHVTSYVRHGGWIAKQTRENRFWELAQLKSISGQIRPLLPLRPSQSSYKSIRYDM